MKLAASIEEAIQLIETFIGPPSEFLLLLPDELNDPIGINMAIITDLVLSRGWQPYGFDQASGYRVYKFESIE